jgi:integrase
MYFLG